MMINLRKLYTNVLLFFCLGCVGRNVGQ